MKTALNKIISIKSLKWISLAVFIASIIPLIILGCYSHPAADDYSFCKYGIWAWNDTHNIFLVIWGGICRAYEFWRDWQGYFTSNFAMTMSPAIFGPKAYIIVTPLILGFLFTGVTVFFRKVFNKVMGINSDITWTVIFLFMFIVVQCMPKSARAEALFWYNGASTYIFLGSISLMFYALLISLYEKNEKNSKIKIILSSILAFFVGGANLLTALNVAFVLALMWVIFFISKKAGRAKSLIGPSIGYYIGFICNVASPGNEIKEDEVIGMSAVKSILIPLEEFFTMILDEWLIWPIILLLIILIPLFWKGLEKTKYEFKYPVVAIILGYAVSSAMMTPPLFALSDMSAGRLVASIFSVFMIITVLLEAYLIGWVRNQYEKRLGAKLANEEVSGTEEAVSFGMNSVYMIAAVLACFVFASVLTVVPNNDYFTYSEAVRELTSGEARAFSESMTEREKIFEECAKLPEGQRNAYIYPLKAEPPLLFVIEMRGADAEWIERVTCSALRLDSITMIEE